MLEKFLSAFVRLVVAAESIADSLALQHASADPKANGTKPASKTKPDVATDDDGEGEDDTPVAKPTRGAARTRGTSAKGKPAADDGDDDGEDDKPVAKTTRAKRGAAKDKPDTKIADLRKEITTLAEVVAVGDGLEDKEADACVEEYQDMLKNYGVKAVTKLADADVEDFHTDLKALAEVYFDLED